MTSKETTEDPIVLEILRTIRGNLPFPTSKREIEDKLNKIPSHFPSYFASLPGCVVVQHMKELGLIEYGRVTDEEGYFLTDRSLRLLYIVGDDVIYESVDYFYIEKFDLNVRLEKNPKGAYQYRIWQGTKGKSITIKDIYDDYGI